MVEIKNPLTINLVVNQVTGDNYVSRKSTIFEEVFHAAQRDDIKDNNYPKDAIALEVEAKLLKTLKG